MGRTQNAELGPGRFAPSTSGPPHPGTLASALLVWLDARSRGVPVFLRFENLDPQRAKGAFVEAIGRSLVHMGLSFDAVSFQNEQMAAHAAALDRLAQLGLLYACDCRRPDIRRRKSASGSGRAGVGPDYDNHCRYRSTLAPRAWRTCPYAIRVKLPAQYVRPVDVGGLDLTQIPAHAVGDPIVRRSDGSVAYVLASIVDDASSQVGHIVRGIDLAALTATQVALMHLLELAVPSYRHHAIVYDPSGRKWSKSKLATGSVQPNFLQWAGDALVGQMAYCLGITTDARPIAPPQLLTRFSWDAVTTCNVMFPSPAQPMAHRVAEG